MMIPEYINKEVPPWNHLIVPEVIMSALKAPVKGQGLWSTIWNGWKYTSDIYYASEAYRVVKTEKT